MHGQFPFPEATAITEVLVTGEKGGSQAKLLLQATVIAAIYDFFVTTFHVWREYLDFQFVPLMRNLAERGRMVFNFDAIGFILGLGYVMGLRSAMIFCAGSIMTSFVLVPLIWFVGSHIDVAIYPAVIPISKMTAVEIYRDYVRFIGVGAIATAGIVGILKSLRIVAGSFGIALHAFRYGEAAHTERTDRDIPILSILLGVVAGALCVAIFFGRLQVSWTVLALGLVLTLLFSFFFTSVAANAIATTANNPASGMTMLTLIVSSVVLLNFGLSGTTGMFFIMAIAGMVCTALCASGQFITDLKIGYWLGSTPAAQQKVKFLGVAAAAITAGLTIILLAHTFQFGEAAPGDARQVLAAPQASIMKALVVGFMSRQPVAYLLFGIGALITLILEMLGKSSMVFALGNLSAARPHFAHPRRRSPLASRQQARGKNRRRARPQHSRARRHSGIGTDGRRRAGRRSRRIHAPLPGISRGPDRHAVLRQRSHLAAGLRAAVSLVFVSMFGSVP